MCFPYHSTASIIFIQKTKQTTTKGRGLTMCGCVSYILSDKMLTSNREKYNLPVTCVNRAVFCPVITFSACPCVEDAPTPTLPWTTEAGVSCFPELWGEGWPTRKVPCSRNKLGRSAMWNTVKQKSRSVITRYKPAAIMPQHSIF